jgi:ribosomal protein S10
MTTLDIEIAVIKASHIRQNLVVPNVSWGMVNNDGILHECDILVLTPSGYATEIEIKVSKYDLLKDAEKRHNHNHNLIRKFYFAVPESLKQIALESIPERAGLYVVSEIEATKYKWFKGGGNIAIPYKYRRVTTVKEAKINTNAVKWDDYERYQLARLGTLRILGLKEKIQKLKG